MDRTRVRHPVIRRGIISLLPALAAVAAIGAAGGCVENHRQIKPDPGAFAWPTAIVADPAGDFVYVLSSNFDSECTGGTIIPVSTDTLEIMSAGAVEIGSFCGEGVVTPLADGRWRIWVPSRDGDSLEFADISRPGGFPVLFCDGDAAEDAADDDSAGMRPLDDGSGAPVPMDYIAGDADQDVAGDLPGFHDCNGSYSIHLKDFAAEHEDGTTSFADNPFGVAAGGWVNLADGRRVQPIYVTGIVGSAIDVFLADDRGAVEHAAVAAIEAGSHSVLEYMVTDYDRVVWISNRELNEIVIAHVRIHADGKVDIRVDDSAAADILGSNGDYFRGIARSQVGPFLYATYRSPAGLAVFEITAGGGLRYRHLIHLDGNPSGIAVYGNADGTETVYVTENSLDYVYAVDPVSMTVTDTVFVGASPYGIAIANDRAFVVNFEDSTMSVFGVNPDSADFHVVTSVE